MDVNEVRIADLSVRRGSGVLEAGPKWCLHPRFAEWSLDRGHFQTRHRARLFREVHCMLQVLEVLFYLPVFRKQRPNIYFLCLRTKYNFI